MASPTVEVVIPTRNRPQQLARCLAALEQARGALAYDVLVADSSEDAHHHNVRAIVRNHRFAGVIRHTGRNAAAARNACARNAGGALLVSVDDDVYVEADAITSIVNHWRNAQQPCAVAGSVKWADDWSRPIVIRANGYGRAAAATEKPDFLISAFIAYDRELALRLPWNEGIRTSEDRFMGAVWRRHGVAMEYCASARARHDIRTSSYGVRDQSDQIYVNLFDALLASRSPTRALSYELLGFAAGAKGFIRSPASAARYAASWSRGHRALWREWSTLREMTRVRS